MWNCKYLLKHILTCKTEEVGGGLGRERKEAKCPGEGRGSSEKIYLLLIIDFAGSAVLTRANLAWCSDGQEVAVPLTVGMEKAEWSQQWNKDCSGDQGEGAWTPEVRDNNVHCTVWHRRQNTSISTPSQQLKTVGRKYVHDIVARHALKPRGVRCRPPGHRVVEMQIAQVATVLLLDLVLPC